MTLEGQPSHRARMVQLEEDQPMVPHGPAIFESIYEKTGKDRYSQTYLLDVVN